MWNTSGVGVPEMYVDQVMKWPRIEERRWNLRNGIPRPSWVILMSSKPWGSWPTNPGLDWILAVLMGPLSSSLVLPLYSMQGLWTYWVPPLLINVKRILLLLFCFYHLPLRVLIAILLFFKERNKALWQRLLSCKSHPWERAGEHAVKSHLSCDGVRH